MPRYTLRILPEVQAIIDGLEAGKKKNPARARKVAKALRQMADDPEYPGLHSHRFEALDDVIGERMWESYVENRTPSAWRVWWFYGPNDGEITIVDLDGHP